MNIEIEEIWKDVVGFEGLYKVSSTGLVKRLQRAIYQTNNGTIYKHLFKEKIRKQVIDRHGYLTVQLHKNKSVKHCTVHRLVALAFIPNPENKSTVNHKNGIKTDNRVENLEWNTHSENVQHSYKTGLKIQAKGLNSKSSIPISQFTLDGTWIRDWANAYEVQREMGYRRNNISSCVTGKKKSASGFIWKRNV